LIYAKTYICITKDTLYCCSKQADGEAGVEWWGYWGGGNLSIELWEIEVKFVPEEEKDRAL